MNPRKIVATTNKRIGIEREKAGDNTWEDRYPKPSKSFVEKYEALGTIKNVLVDYEYTITTDIGCTNTEIITVTVHPSPSLDFTVLPITKICSGEEFTYTPVLNTTPVTTGSVTWTRVDIAGITSSGVNSGTGTITETLTNSTSNSIAVTYQLELPPTDPQGCTATETIVVNVNPAPIAAISGGGDSCLNDTDNLITFTGSNGSAPYTFEYTIDGSALHTITTVSNNNSVQVGSSTSTIGSFTYELQRIIDANGCETDLSGAPLATTINVIAAPTLIITDPQPIVFTLRDIHLLLNQACLRIILSSNLQAFRCTANNHCCQ